MNLFHLRGVYTVIDRRHQRAKKVVSDSLGLHGFYYWASDFNSAHPKILGAS